MPTKILVVGGAGYIGSHMVAALKQANYEPIVLDNLSTGHRDLLLDTPLYVSDVSNKNCLDEIFRTHSVSAVMHFASFIQVGESVSNPAKYYDNNVLKTLVLLQKMLEHRVKNFIFSSSAAVYGEPKYTPIDEKHPLSPLNPYGHSKRMIEQVLEDYAAAYDFHFASLRYFNAAGAHPEGYLCEAHEPETHLIPLILQVASGKKAALTVHGRDYLTPDGTCIRDYVHVHDLCQAHLLALKALFEGQKKGIYNVGTGHGFSVQQVIDTVASFTKKSIPVLEGERRPGDPAILIADASLITKELNWQPHYPELGLIIEHAWNALTFFESKRNTVCKTIL